MAWYSSGHNHTILNNVWFSTWTSIQALSHLRKIVSDRLSCEWQISQQFICISARCDLGFRSKRLPALLTTPYSAPTGHGTRCRDGCTGFARSSQSSGPSPAETEHDTTSTPRGVRMRCTYRRRYIGGRSSASRCRTCWIR